MEGFVGAIVSTFLSQADYQMTSDPDPAPTEAQIAEAASRLEHIEEWLAKTNTAGSALGRLVCQDQAAISRWRAVGTNGCREEKRRALAEYVLTHPDGIPGYKGGKQGKKPNARQSHAKFSAGGRTPSSSRANRLSRDGGSTAIPVPALSELETQDDADWIRSEAFRRRVPLAQVLAECVTLGIRVAREEAYEREHEQAERNDNAPYS
jgi:hypothetical protein